MPTRPVHFAARERGGAGPRLAGRLRVPERPATSGAAVLCHPHPGFGGHMDVWLLPVIAERLAADGWTVLRFDVRGAGASEPDPLHRPTTGAVEVADLRAALDLLDEAAPPGRRAVVGWSFGALLGLLHGPDDARVTDWVGIAPPVRPVEGVALAPCPVETVARWSARRTAIVGSHDAMVPPPSVSPLRCDRVVEVAGADHFFFDRDDEVAGLVAAALAAGVHGRETT